MAVKLIKPNIEYFEQLKEYVCELQSKKMQREQMVYIRL